MKKKNQIEASWFSMTFACSLNPNLVNLKPKTKYQSKYLLKVAENDACGTAVLLINPFLNLFVSTRIILFNLLIFLCWNNLNFK